MASIASTRSNAASRNGDRSRPEVWSSVTLGSPAQRGRAASIIPGAMSMPRIAATLVASACEATDPAADIQDLSLGPEHVDRSSSSTTSSVATSNRPGSPKE